MVKIPKVRKAVIYGIIFILAITALSYIKLHRFEYGIAYVISSDAQGYFQYLPAIFIHHDFFDQSYGYQLDNGQCFNKYNYGVALMQLPFFLIAFVVNLFLKLPVYSRFSPYAFMAIVSGAFYTWWGMTIMYRLLRNNFNQKVCLVTIGSIFLGSNLFYYAYISPGHSHLYAFFLVSCILYFTAHFYQSPGWRSILSLSLFIGILALIRITHIIVILYILFYQVSRIKDISYNFKFLYSLRYYLLIIPISILLLYVPQFIYWYGLTSSIFINPYKNEGFFFWDNPQIYTVLFSPTGGWLIVSPILLLSIVGIFKQFQIKIGSPIAVSLILIFITYIYASWWVPTLAGSYGHRGFVDIYPFLLFPFAIMINAIYSKSNPRFIFVFHGILALLIFINIRYSYFFNSAWFYVDYSWSGLWQSILKVFFIGEGFH